MKSEKTVFRIRKTSNYVSISRFTLEDKRLSWEARGLHAFLLAKPDNWKTCIAHLIKCSPAGRDKTRRIINELMSFNYIIKSEQRSTEGQYSSPQYIVYETPHDGFLDGSIKLKTPETENPSTVNPLTGNPSTLIHPLLSIQTEPSIQVTKNTTTTSQEFIWSSRLTRIHQESIIALLKGVDKEIAQLLLDELAGQINFIKNPVGYFRSLLEAYLQGGFVPAKALQIQASRKVAMNNDDSVERSRKFAEEQIQIKLKSFRSKKCDN